MKTSQGFELSPQQSRALDLVTTWRRSQDNPYFLLAGYAGTGKTTIAKILAADVHGPVYYAAYTGKAAHVLRKTGIDQVSTIHQLIYTPRDKCEDHLTSLLRKRAELVAKGNWTPGQLAKIDEKIAKEHKNLHRPEFTLNQQSPLEDAALLVLDEYSMVDEQTGKDLLSFGCPILALGDPGQLPPIYGQGYFSDKPDVLLTEIHRQAAENPIIRMSKDVREGKALRPGQYGSSRVVAKTGITPQIMGRMILDADQLLVGTNKTRHHFNAEIRKMYSRIDPCPVVGDRLVCLRNNHDERLLNGQLFTVLSRVKGESKFIQLLLQGEDGSKTTCLAHRDYFEGDPMKMLPTLKKQANEFDFGYALTVHKAQGSQWDNVVLVDEWKGKDRQKWLYTAITRAAESIVVLV